jgi:hypothetical protein
MSGSSGPPQKRLHQSVLAFRKTPIEQGTKYIHVRSVTGKIEKKL